MNNSPKWTSYVFCQEVDLLPNTQVGVCRPNPTLTLPSLQDWLHCHVLHGAPYHRHSYHRHMP